MQIIFYVYNNSSNCSGPGKNYQPDWECKDCKINNFVKRTKCFRIPRTLLMTWKQPLKVIYEKFAKKYLNLNLKTNGP